MRQNVNILRHDIVTHPLAAARKRRYLRPVLLARCAREILEEDIRDGQWRRIFEALCEIRLAVALVDFDGIVDVIDVHFVVGDVLDTASASAALEVATEGGGGVGPNFDAGSVLGCVRWPFKSKERTTTYACVVHRDIINVYVLHNGVDSDVLT